MMLVEHQQMAIIHLLLMFLHTPITIDFWMTGQHQMGEYSKKVLISQMLLVRVTQDLLKMVPPILGVTVQQME